MKTKFLVSLIAILAVLTFVATSVYAASSAEGDLTGVSISNVNVNGVDVMSLSDSLVDYNGNTAVVRVQLSTDGSHSDQDARIKVSIGDSEATVKDIVLTTGTHYQYLVLKLPTDIDETESTSLYVRVEAGSQHLEQHFDVTLQRQTYDLEILSVDSDKTIKAGDTLPVDVVLKNNGFRQLTDIFVVASIDELGVEKKVYFEDLTSNDTCDDCNKRDSAERTINLRIPSNAKAGVYEMKVEAYNDDSSAVMTSKIVVVGAEDESRVVVPMTSKDIAAGQTVSYDIVIVNSGSKVGVYEIVPETTSGLTLTAQTPIITIPAGSSEIVKVDVKASNSGTYSFAVGINSEGKLVQRVVLNANVSGAQVFSGNVVVLTIILAIVFLVLLVVLIVLLTRKPAKSAELEESYY